MQSVIGKSTIVAAAMAAGFVAAYAQDPIASIEGYYPTQVNPGQTTTLNVAFNVARGGNLQLYRNDPAP